MIHMTSLQLTSLFPQPSKVVSFEFKGVQTDTRKPCDGQLFVALKGDRFDAHDYLEKAQAGGAVAALVERKVDIELPQIIVEDTRHALGELARAWRRSIAVRVVGITGSNGKTTVKEMLGAILSGQQPTLMTRGNLNNDIGVPLTLFELSAEHRFAVIEMGANHAGEIRRLVEIAEPDLVYVNNARAAHVEGFGSVDGVVHAKGEMYQYAKPAALAVFNEDEVAVDYWKSVAASDNHLSFSSRKPADVYGSSEPQEQGQKLSLTYRNERVECRLVQRGEHNAQNACAAITLALACGIDLNTAASALQSFTGVKGRQQNIEGPKQSLIIDDSYNANPDSLSTALQVLITYPGRHWLALGDMAELGEQAESLHHKAVHEAREIGVEQLFAYGALSCRAARAFEQDGHCFDDHESMARYIDQRLDRDVVLLVKGSRSAGMDRLVTLLAQNSKSEAPGVRHAL